MKQAASLAEIISATKLEAEIWEAIASNGGEVSDEQDRLLKLIDSLPNKADGWGFYFDRTESRVRDLDEQIDKLKKIRDLIETEAARRKEYLQRLITSSGQLELQGNEHVFKIVGCARRTVVENETALPAKYKILETKQVIDKALLKKDLEAGVPVPGASLQGGTRLKKDIRK